MSSTTIDPSRHKHGCLLQPSRSGISLLFPSSFFFFLYMFAAEMQHYPTVLQRKTSIQCLEHIVSRTARACGEPDNLFFFGANYFFFTYSTVGCRRTVCRRTARLEFHLKIRTTPGWKNELRTISPHANSVCCEDGFFGAIADFKTTPFRRFKTFQPHSPHVCTQQANRHDSQTDWKIRTRLAEVVKNKNDPGWDRLPPVLRHPTVL